MILQALYQLYQRRMADPDPARRLPIYGFEDKAIPYIIDIDHDGKLINLRSTYNNAKKPVATQYLAPMSVKKTSGVAANLLWDNLEYVLGVDTRGKPQRVAEQHAAFRARIRALADAAQQDAGIIAINRFLDQFQIEQVAGDPDWAAIMEANPLMTFQLAGDNDPVFLRQAVFDNIGPDESATASETVPETGQETRAATAANGTATAATGAELDGICLISGETGPIERLHSAIKGVWGAQTAGANIVSFNADAYCSFGKNGLQGANAPVSKKAAFGYTTALNALLARDSGQRVQVGDTSTVLWAKERDPDDMESTIANIFGEPPKDHPERGAEAVKRLYQWINSGKAQSLAAQNPFYVLGLAPNAARISIRFWECLPLGELAKRTVQHFDDLRIKGAPFDPPYPSLFRLLASCAAQGKADNIPPNLGGDVIRAALNGLPYPRTFFTIALNRCRAEQDINYMRASILKACLIRQTGKEVPTMLDLSNQSTGYRLGCLFAVLERLQQEAISPNTSVRDRYFGAAMTSPLMVFNPLIRLHAHHLSKLAKNAKKRGTGVWLDKLITQIMQQPFAVPAQLAAPEQAMFAIGYYQQRQDFFSKAPADTATETDTATLNAE
jgi:CRISPR-associated protein Csd1